MSLPKTIVAVVSCARDQATHDAPRNTWVRTAEGVDYKFFMGRGSLAKQADEVVLNAGDGYGELTEKALATIEWVLSKGYKYMLHIGRDTYISVPRMLGAGLWQYEYAGNCGCQGDFGFCPLSPVNNDIPFHFASGGTGSWLSDTSMRLILKSPIRHYADDLMFGWILGSQGIPLWSDNRFQKRGKCFYSTNQFTLHLSRGPGNYKFKWMYEAHELELLKRKTCSLR